MTVKLFVALLFWVSAVSGLTGLLSLLIFDQFMIVWVSAFAALSLHNFAVFLLARIHSFAAAKAEQKSQKG